MREQLAAINNVRDRFTATFERFGTKKGYEGRTIKTLLFVEIKKSGVLVCDHVWFTTGKQFECLDLKPGDMISFNARAKTYKKGYRGRRDFDFHEDAPTPPSIDYRLSHPTSITMHIGTQHRLF